MVTQAVNSYFFLFFQYMFLYIHTYVFFAVNLGLQLFLGIVVNNFNEHKPGHTFLLSLEQNRWSELMQRVSLQRPIKLPPEPRKNLSIYLFFYLSIYPYYIIYNVYRDLYFCWLLLKCPF